MDFAEHFGDRFFDDPMQSRSVDLGLENAHYCLYVAAGGRVDTRT